MKPTNAYLNAIKSIPPDIQKQTSYSFAISDRIHELLTKKGMTQKELAKGLGCLVSIISPSRRWLRYQFSLVRIFCLVDI